MKIWLISQTQNEGYDTFDSAIVAAETEELARNINPDGEWDEKFSAWCRSPDYVSVELIGDGYNGEAGVILASFNAG